jgi:hypothetical protein
MHDCNIHKLNLLELFIYHADGYLLLLHTIHPILQFSFKITWHLILELASSVDTKRSPKSQDITVSNPQQQAWATHLE